MSSKFDVVGSVGVKQGSTALPAFVLRGNKGKSGEVFALPLLCATSCGINNQNEML